MHLRGLKGLSGLRYDIISYVIVTLVLFNDKQKQTFINSYQFRCRLKDENRGRNSSLSSVPRDSTTQHQKVRTQRKMGNPVVQKILYAWLRLTLTRFTMDPDGKRNTKHQQISVLQLSIQKFRCVILFSIFLFKTFQNRLFKRYNKLILIRYFFRQKHPNI